MQAVMTCSACCLKFENTGAQVNSGNIQTIFSKRDADNLVDGYDLRLVQRRISFNWINGDSILSPFNIDDDKVLSEAHVFVGCEQFPTKKKSGSYTVAPGQYPFNPYLGGYVQNFSVEGISATGGIYVIAHAVVCLENNR